MAIEPEARVAHLLVLRAFALDEELCGALVLKGAYATEAITQRQRSTLDIDLTEGPERKLAATYDRAGEQALKSSFHRAVSRFLIGVDEGWSLETVSAQKAPRDNPHPHGWDGFRIKITLLYRRRRQHVVPIDLSFGDATDELVRLSCDRETIEIAGPSSRCVLRSYSPEQIVAEKLRAFLQHLEPYQTKIGATHRTPPRVRDLHDIAALVAACGEALGLRQIADAFRLKCAAKSVDCEGVTAFFADEGAITLYQQLYENDRDLAEISFEQAWQAVTALLERLFAERPPPGRFPLSR